MDGTEAPEDHVTTIRVVGVPARTTHTEFNCWFLFAEGFQQAKLLPSRGPTGSQLGWVRFETVADAQAAADYLNGRQLTQDQAPEAPVLAAEFAKSNFRPTGAARRTDAPKSFNPPPPAAFNPPPAAVLPPAAFNPPPLPVLPAAAYALPLRPPRPMIGRVEPAGMNPPPPAVLPARSTRCSTLFVGGLQANSSETEKELSDLVSQQCAGFERMKFRIHPRHGGMAFAKFATADHAEAALQFLGSGVALPSNPGHALQVELARNELDQKPDMPSGAPQTALAALFEKLQPRPRTQLPVGIAPPPAAVRPAHLQQHQPRETVLSQQEPAQPRDTLFVGRLPPTVTEDELSGVLTGLPGFLRAKLVGLGTAKPVAFVLFDSVEACAQALSELDGAALPSSPTHALACQFSKNSLDKRQRQA